MNLVNLTWSAASVERTPGSATVLSNFDTPTKNARQNLVPAQKRIRARRPQGPRLSPAPEPQRVCCCRNHRGIRRRHLAELWASADGRPPKRCHAWPLARVPLRTHLPRAPRPSASTSAQRTERERAAYIPRPSSHLEVSTVRGPPGGRHRAARPGRFLASRYVAKRCLERSRRDVRSPHSRLAVGRRFNLGEGPTRRFFASLSAGERALRFGS